jgi:hypothetical protein
MNTAKLPWDSFSSTRFDAEYHGVMADLVNRKIAKNRDFRSGSRSCVKTFLLPQKLHATGGDPRRHDGLSIFLLYRVQSQPGRKLGSR